MDKDGTIEIFDLMGFHPETREELQPITPEIVGVWKAQNERREADKLRRPPQRIDDPESFAFFDALTGNPRVWYWRGPNGEYEFYDNPGYHPRTGEQLTVITREAIAAWKRDIETAKRKQIETREREERDRQHALEQQSKKAEQEERDRQYALEQERQKQEKFAAQQEHERQAGTLCDQTAANPSDVRKPADVAGISYNDLKTNAQAAVEACAIAMRGYPAEVRYRYEYARALEIDEPQKALELHMQLVQEGYLASYDNAGSILIGTYKNVPKAIKYFKEGAQRGDPDSMLSLADLIDKHIVPENNPVAARYALLSRAAQLGHAGAQRFLDQERVEFQQLQRQREFQQQQQQLMLQMFGTIMQGIPHH